MPDSIRFAVVKNPNRFVAATYEVPTREELAFNVLISMLQDPPRYLFDLYDRDTINSCMYSLARRLSSLFHSSALESDLWVVKEYYEGFCGSQKVGRIARELFRSAIALGTMRSNDLFSRHLQVSRHFKWAYQPVLTNAVVMYNPSVTRRYGAGVFYRSSGFVPNAFVTVTPVVPMTYEVYAYYLQDAYKESRILPYLLKSSLFSSLHDPASLWISNSTDRGSGIQGDAIITEFDRIYVQKFFTSDCNPSTKWHGWIMMPTSHLEDIAL
ncbi:MAG: hypothetical protein D6698_09835 [Gammaproteobacteria bacterium]|nr:MAG: hypothetical protein D6698_09835 [Gammaproteobacteria bacterium]